MEEIPKDPIRRVFYLLTIISVWRGNWFTLADLVLRAQLPQTTCYRYLTIFCEEGVIEKSEQAKLKTADRSETTVVMYRHKRK